VVAPKAKRGSGSLIAWLGCEYAPAIAPGLLLISGPSMDRRETDHLRALELGKPIDGRVGCRLPKPFQGKSLRPASHVGPVQHVEAAPISNLGRCDSGESKTEKPEYFDVHFEVPARFFNRASNTAKFLKFGFWAGLQLNDRVSNP
jgi:hypothetical protein